MISKTINIRRCILRALARGADKPEDVAVSVRNLFGSIHARTIERHLSALVEDGFASRSGSHGHYLYAVTREQVDAFSIKFPSDPGYP